MEGISVFRNVVFTAAENASGWGIYHVQIITRVIRSADFKARHCIWWIRNPCTLPYWRLEIEHRLFKLGREAFLNLFSSPPWDTGSRLHSAPDKWQPRKLQGGDRTLVQFCLRVHAKQVNQQV